jgi:anti-sigma factor RsiW
MTMRCNDALRAIHEVLDGEASEARIAELLAHTQECTSCARVYEELLHWDAVLRDADADEPDDAYFHAMASRISATIQASEPQRTPLLAPSWSFASALAAACLVLGLGVGHFALPRTLTETKTVVQRVPGPVREVERVVKEEVRVPVGVPVEVVRWRTRTVTKVKEVPTEPSTRRVAEVADHVEPSRPTPTVAAVAEETAEAPAPVATPPTTSSPSYVTLYASLPRGAAPSSGRSLQPDDISALARRLSEDMGRLDEALSAPRLASALVSDIETADAEIERAITVEASGAGPQ